MRSPKGKGRAVSRTPWGSSEVLFQNRGQGKITVKILTVEPDSRLSLQLHRQRREFWFVLDGDAEATVGDGRRALGPGQALQIPPGTLHRLGTTGGTKVLEVSTGHFSENDVVRLEDDYGRAQ